MQGQRSNIKPIKGEIVAVVGGNIGIHTVINSSKTKVFLSHLSHLSVPCARPQRRAPDSVRFSDLLQHFVSMQQRHSQMRRKNASYLFRNNTAGMIR